MISRSLVAKAQRLINQMQPLSEVPAAQGGEMGHGHADSQMPPGVGFTNVGGVTRSASTLEMFGGRLDRAEAHDSNVEYSAAIDWGSSALHDIQHSPYVREETPHEFRARICQSYEGVPAGKVAARERTSVTTVRDAREADGRDARQGHKLKAVAK